MNRDRLINMAEAVVNSMRARQATMNEAAVVLEMVAAAMEEISIKSYNQAQAAITKSEEEIRQIRLDAGEVAIPDKLTNENEIRLHSLGVRW